MKSVSRMSRDPSTQPSGSRRETAGFDLPLDTPPMEARLMHALPASGRWQYEPKWDGFRCLVFKAGARIELIAKSGKPLGRYFPEVVGRLGVLPMQRFVVDGELLIASHGRYDFDALQMRLHPAQSRIEKLAASMPAQLMLFDMLVDPQAKRLLDAPLTERRSALDRFVEKAHMPEHLLASEHTEDAKLARRWLDELRFGTDGVVAKALEGPYVPGERAMMKVKRIRTADCVIGGFRYGTNSRQVGSLLLGLYDEAGRLNHVGFTSSIKAAQRPALTRQLEALVEPPGFTGRAPGGPSRWSTERSGEWTPLRPELVVEVGFDHVTNDRFRHGATLLRWRPDKSPRQCALEQIRTPQ